MRKDKNENVLSEDDDTQTQTCMHVPSSEWKFIGNEKSIMNAT